MGVTVQTRSFPCDLICLCTVLKTDVFEQEVEVHSFGLARTALESCPWGWQRYERRCFKFVSTTRTWAEAERYCVMMGGNLASVHSRNEYYFVQDLVRKNTQSTPVTWIGGCDAAQEGLWLWSDGSRFDYSHWNTAEPNNLEKIEHCLHFNWGGPLGWNDIPCNRLYPSVCSMHL
ncbi:ladderlectin-like [Engraulis encrasicolus]|uniref:ladderlectin-like n=1 Tax=Engraulis encrasicolus TaxID=184585 RepID=UPI002FD51849